MWMAGARDKYRIEQGGCFSMLLGLFIYGWTVQAIAAGAFNGFDVSNALIPTSEIYPGGPPRDGIPAIDRPKFVPAAQADFLADDDRVLGLNRNGIQRAYPIKILNYHEIINDRIGDESLLISYCPLCGTGMAFLATLKGKAHSFGVSGLLYNSDVLFYDRETESLWSQIKKQAVSGPMRGTGLQQIVMAHTNWNDWRRRHPNTQVLSLQTGYKRDYNRSPYSGYEKSTQTYFPVSTTDRRYHLKEQVIGLSLDGVDKAYPFVELLKTKGAIRDRVGDHVLTIEFDSVNRTGRVLDASGEVVPTTIAYWFAWVAFHPQTDVYKLKSELLLTD